MKRDDQPASIINAPDTGGSAGSIFASLADTTWRVAVPTVLFSALGILADKKWHTMPLYTLIGLVVGLTAAGILVWHQIQNVTKTEDKK